MGQGLMGVSLLQLHQLKSGEWCFSGGEFSDGGGQDPHALQGLRFPTLPVISGVGGTGTKCFSAALGSVNQSWEAHSAPKL